MVINFIIGFLGKIVTYIRCTVSEKLEIDHEYKRERRQETDFAKVASGDSPQYGYGTWSRSWHFLIIHFCFTRL